MGSESAGQGGDGQLQVIGDLGLGVSVLPWH